MIVEVPVSVGELVDKVTILKIKLERIAQGKRANVAHELTLLEAILGGILPRFPEVRALSQQLEDINSKLWDIEDGKRRCEREKNFGARFIDLARAVYIENDRRAAIKREINLATGSAIVEEKSHAA